MLFVTKQPHLYNDRDYEYELSTCRGFLHRSPSVDLAAPYICCVGNSFTFGRFVKKPYPLILSEITGIPVLNLGFGHLSPEKIQFAFTRIINNSLLTIAQFRFKTSEIQIDAKIKLNWGETFVEDVLNVEFEPNPVSQHYPSQNSHIQIADILANELRLLFDRL